MIQRAFMYGDLLFETIRVDNKGVRNLAKHYRRLLHGAALLRYELPGGFNEDSIRSAIEAELLKRDLREARVRYVMYRNSEGYYTPNSNKIEVEIEATGLMAPRVAITKLGVYQQVKKSCNALSNLKSGNALLYVLAGIYARERGLDDCIILNEHDNVCESISSNIFVSLKGKLYTPALSEGCVKGVMRECVMEAAAEAKIPVVESTMPMSMLHDADEIFFTNSIQGVTPVTLFEEKKYGNDVASIFAKLI